MSLASLDIGLEGPNHVQRVNEKVGITTGQLEEDEDILGA